MKRAKLRKHFAYQYKDKRCYKHVITIPESIIRKLGWQAGMELEQKVEGNALVIRPLTSQNSTTDSTKMSSFEMVKEENKEGNKTA